MSGPANFCPMCGQPFPAQVGKDTIKLSQDALNELVPQAVRTPLPPAPAPLETVIVNLSVAETMPDAGWLVKHLRERDRRLRRWGIAVGVVVAIAIFACALVR